MTAEELIAAVDGEGDTTPAAGGAVVRAVVPARDLLPGSADHQVATGGLPVTQQQAASARLAQIVNLHIAGYSLAQIGDSIGASADEVDRMLQQDASRYVRTQPVLRTYVRNWVSERYTKLLDTVWVDATDPTKPKMLESQDRALRILDRMAKLHGAEAPIQSEIKVESAPETVERLVDVLSKAQGMGYDASIFDVIDAEVLHESVEQAHEITVVSGNAVEQSQPEDEAGV